MKCKGCKENIKKGEPIQIVPLGQVHVKCMDDFINKAIIKAKLKRQKKQEEMKAYKKAVKKKSDLMLTQDVFNRYIRWRDTRPDGIGACISCKNTVKFGEKSCHAGHYYTRGARSDLRFNEDNVHAQCSQCNEHNNCRIPGSVMENYKKHLIEKIGEKRYKKLSKVKQQDYSIKTLKEMRKKYNKLMKE
jgi:hypothetical protein